MQIALDACRGTGRHTLQFSMGGNCSRGDTALFSTGSGIAYIPDGRTCPQRPELPSGGMKKIMQRRKKNSNDSIIPSVETLPANLNLSTPTTKPTTLG